MIVRELSHELAMLAEPGLYGLEILRESPFPARHLVAEGLEHLLARIDLALDLVRLRVERERDRLDRLLLLFRRRAHEAREVVEFSLDPGPELRDGRFAPLAHLLHEIEQLASALSLGLPGFFELGADTNHRVLSARRLAGDQAIDAAGAQAVVMKSAQLSEAFDPAAVGFREEADRHDGRDIVGERFLRVLLR